MLQAVRAERHAQRGESGRTTRRTRVVAGKAVPGARTTVEQRRRKKSRESRRSDVSGGDASIT